MDPKNLIIPGYLALETKLNLLSVSSVHFSSAAKEQTEKRDGVKTVLAPV